MTGSRGPVKAKEQKLRIRVPRGGNRIVRSKHLEIRALLLFWFRSWRGLGLGEWMLTRLLETGQALGARVATLEVRPSNRVARSLYEKYGFQEVGRRRRYYSDNGEDALILTSPPLNLPDFQEMLARHRDAFHQRLARVRDFRRTGGIGG